MICFTFLAWSTHCVDLVTWPLPRSLSDLLSACLSHLHLGNVMIEGECWNLGHLPLRSNHPIPPLYLSSPCLIWIDVTCIYWIVLFPLGESSRKGWSPLLCTYWGLLPLPPWLKTLEPPRLESEKEKGAAAETEHPSQSAGCVWGTSAPLPCLFYTLPFTKSASFGERLGNLGPERLIYLQGLDCQNLPSACFLPNRLSYDSTGLSLNPKKGSQSKS